MIELGKIQELEIVREKEFGVYLAEKQGDEQDVLLPRKQVPEGAKIGDTVRVFIYRDSSDRLIATTSEPKLQVGETESLEVKEVSRIGAFLDMGLEKDLLLPFKEQTHPVRKGERCLVTLYVDKSRRLAEKCGVVILMALHIFAEVKGQSGVVGVEGGNGAVGNNSSRPCPPLLIEVGLVFPIPDRIGDQHRETGRLTPVHPDPAVGRHILPQQVNVSAV